MPLFLERLEDKGPGSQGEAAAVGKPDLDLPAGEVPDEDHVLGKPVMAPEGKDFLRAVVVDPAVLVAEDTPISRNRTASAAVPVHRS